MDTTTLETLSLAASDPTPPPDTPQVTPPDLGQQETETPATAPRTTEIPEGYTRDARTGEIRPKKARGRPRKGTPPPKPDTPINRSEDVAPDSKAKGRTLPPTPKWSKGVIGAGMTKLYRRIGKIVKSMDRDIGIAIIESAEDCGEAWDELARTNPRVRAFLTKLITGGAMGSIFVAHLPIALAIIMKDRIRQHIPLMNLMGMTWEQEDSDDEDSFVSEFLGGMNHEDMQAAMNLAGQLMGQTSRRVVPGTVIRGDEDQ